MIATTKQIDFERENRVNADLELWQAIDEINKKYAVLLEKTPSSTQEYANRIADLEVKMAKLWALLIDVTPRGQDKLSRFGKTFGGKSKGML